MRQLLLLALLLPFALANAQTRYQFGDNPRWADPGFDDSAWKQAADGAIATPPFQSSGYLWIRYRVPVRIESSAPLALLLASPPSFRRLPSETWVNGKRIASIGGFPPDLVLVARTQTQVFHLPEGLVPPGSIAVVAQRCWFPPIARDLTTAKSMEIGDREQFRLQERLTLLENEYRTIPSKALYWVSVAFGLFILLIYRRMRGGRELLWFGSYLVASGIFENFELMNGPGEVRTLTEGLWNNLAGLITYGILFPSFFWTAFRLVRIWPLLVSGLTSTLAWFLRTFPVLIAEPYGWLQWPFLNARDLWSISNAIAIWIGLSQAFGPTRSPTPADRALGLALAMGSLMATAGNYGLAKSLPFAGFAIAQLLMVAAMGMVLLHRAWGTFQAQRELESDLDAARQIQTDLLNVARPDSPVFFVDVVSEPARQVGGDFHWFLGSSIDGSLLVLVGDVSGKGLKAAMTVSLAMGILSIEKSKSPAAILAKLNEGLTGRTPGFATCCCARFDPDGTVTVANAGHPAPYVDGREVQLESGLPLGLIQHVVYEESFVKGDRFTFVSDGVVEAENAQRELFGFDRTREISTKPAQEIAEAAKAWGQNDDITVVTVRRRVA